MITAFTCLPSYRYSSFTLRAYLCWRHTYCQWPIIKLTSLVPRPLQDFISQPWRKIGRRPGIKTMPQTGKWWTRLVQTESTLHTDRDHHFQSVTYFCIVLIPGLLPIFLHGCEIKSGSGLGTRLRTRKERLTQEQNGR